MQGTSFDLRTPAENKSGGKLLAFLGGGFLGFIIALLIVAALYIINNSYLTNSNSPEKIKEYAEKNNLELIHKDSLELLFNLLKKSVILDTTIYTIISKEDLDNMEPLIKEVITHENIIVRKRNGKIKFEY